MSVNVVFFCRVKCITFYKTFKCDVASVLCHFHTRFADKRDQWVHSLRKIKRSVKSEMTPIVKGFFKHNFTHHSSDASLVRLALQQVGLNTTANAVFISTPFNLPIGKISIVDVDGTDYQQINLDTERFLSVPSGQALREVKLDSIVPGAFAATQNFSGKVGFILDWQEWIQNTNVPSIFYDGSLAAEFFNRNKRLSNYSGVNGFDIFIFLVADVLHSGVITKYAMFSDKCVIADFNVDPVAVTWTAVTKLFDGDGDETDDIYNEDIRIEIKFTSPTAGGLAIGSQFGLARTTALA